MTLNSDRWSGRRFRTLVLGGLAVGAGLGLVAAAQPWWRATGEGVAARFTGSQSTGGLAQALALTAAAGVVLALVLRVRGRQILGVGLVLLGAGMALTGFDRRRPNGQAVLDQVRQVSLADQFALDPTAWPQVYAGAGLLVAAAAGLAVVTAPRWPRRTERFERTPTPSLVGTDGADPAEIWKAMDAGVDPTEAAATRPDVHEEGGGVRMVATDDSSPSTRPVE